MTGNATCRHIVQRSAFDSPREPRENTLPNVATVDDLLPPSRCRLVKRTNVIVILTRVFTRGSQMVLAAGRIGMELALQSSLSSSHSGRCVKTPQCSRTYVARQCRFWSPVPPPFGAT